MSEYPNPWPDVPSKPPYVLPCDKDAIDAYNANAQEKYRVRTNVLPGPFLGSTAAPVVLLTNMPGVDDRDPEIHELRKFQDLERENYRHVKLDFPFFYLDPNLSQHLGIPSECPGQKFWKKRLKWLLIEFEPQYLAQRILSVPYFPYHSKEFHHASLRLGSQEYGFDIVRQAIALEAIVMIMYGENHWKERVPELKGYKRAFTLKNNRTAWLSPGNCAKFDDVVKAIRDK